MDIYKEIDATVATSLLFVVAVATAGPHNRMMSILSTWRASTRRAQRAIARGKA